MEKRKWSAAIVTAALFFGCISAMGQIAPKHPEQTKFSAEDEGMHNPVAIPVQVIAILSQDKLVRRELKNENLAPDKLPSSWFSASQISLGPRGSKDFVIVGEPPLNGANIVGFWVFVQRNGQYKLALMTGAHDLNIDRSRSHGYRNITASAETCCRITTVHFHLKGTRYEESSEKTEDIR